MNSKQEKLKWYPPCYLFSPPHHNQCLLELLNLELLRPSRKEGIKRTINPPGRNWLLCYWMATNELQNGISLHVASHKWRAVKPKCCND